MQSTKKPTFLIRYIACLFLALLCSCTRYYGISVDSYADKQNLIYGFTRGSSFAIVSDKNENPMLNKEIAHKISRILQERGYNIVNEGQEDYLLRFHVDMTSHTKTVHVEQYIPGQTQITKGNMFEKRKHEKIHGWSYEEKVRTPGTTVLVPEERTIFKKTLGIDVFDTKLSNERESQVWSGTSICSGYSDDLRQVVDYLLISTFNYFGDNTKKNRYVEISENDERIKKLHSFF